MVMQKPMIATAHVETSSAIPDAIAGIDGPRCVDEGESLACRQATSRMHETDESRRKGNGHTGGNDQTLPRRHVCVLAGEEVPSSIPRIAAAR